MKGRALAVLRAGVQNRPWLAVARALKLGVTPGVYVLVADATGSVAVGAVVALAYLATAGLTIATALPPPRQFSSTPVRTYHTALMLTRACVYLLAATVLYLLGSHLLALIALGALLLALLAALVMHEVSRRQGPASDG